MFKAIGSLLKRIPLIEQIAVGLVIGIAVAVLAPGAVPFLGIFGDLFVKALKGVAPLLVFIQRKSGADTAMKPIIVLYVIGTFCASLVGVGMSFLFPTTLQLQVAEKGVEAPSGIAEVLHNVIMNVVDNPINALATGNYIGILSWALIIGIALHISASDSTKAFFQDYLGYSFRTTRYYGASSSVRRSQRPVRTAWICTASGRSYRILPAGSSGNESADCVLQYS